MQAAHNVPFQIAEVNRFTPLVGDAAASGGVKREVERGDWIPGAR
jgi:hypothetical protein